MDSADIDAALRMVYDTRIVFHAFTADTRDYEVVAGMQPYLRFLFKCCVEAEVQSRLSFDSWRRPVDDGHLDLPTGKELIASYTYGVNALGELYPGGSVVEDSPRARGWAETLNIPFHEARFETSVQNIYLVFSDLEVTTLEPGYAPFVLNADD